MQQFRSAGAQVRALTHYERLQVSPLASAEVIRAAYRALAALHHPDRAAAHGGGACPAAGAPDTSHARHATHGAHPTAAACSSTQTMAQINAAYAVLSDPHQRRAYDAELAAEAAAPARAPSGGLRLRLVLASRLRPWRAVARRWARRAPAHRALLVAAAALTLLAGGSAWVLGTLWRTEQAMLMAWHETRSHGIKLAAAPGAWAGHEGPDAIWRVADPGPAGRDEMAFDAAPAALRPAVYRAGPIPQGAAGVTPKAAALPYARAEWAGPTPVHAGETAEGRAKVGAEPPWDAQAHPADGRGAGRQAAAPLPGGVPLRLRAAYTLSAPD